MLWTGSDTRPLYNPASLPALSSSHGIRDVRANPQLLMVRLLIESAFRDALRTCAGQPTEEAVNAMKWLTAKTDWTRRAGPIPPAGLRRQFPFSFEWCCSLLGLDPDQLREHGIVKISGLTVVGQAATWYRCHPRTLATGATGVSSHPFTRESAIHKVRLAEDGWNTRDPEKVALAYAIDSRWRNRSEFINGRQDIIAFLSRKWAKELDYRLIKEMWAFTGNRIAVRFAYEWHDDSGHWYRSYGNENWELNADGLMAARFASINDLPILESERKYHWVLGRRPDDHPGLGDLGL